MKSIKGFLLFLVLGLVFAGSAEASINKTMPGDADLGDTITITLDVNNTDVNDVTVEDLLPANLKLIPGTFEVDGQVIVPTVLLNSISTDVNTGLHQVVFDVQVVEVEASDIDLINFARVIDEYGIEDSNDSESITLYPYEGFVKEINDWSGTDIPGATATNVPIHTDIHWWLRIAVENIASDDVNVMGDVVVKDRLGGDLELDDVNSVSVGAVDDSKTKGKTEKQFLTWAIGTLNDANDAELIIEISTDINPGQGKKSSPKNEYTETGMHCLNSGAVVKFIDVEGTGFQLSAHTPEICVEAFDPEEE